jgi:type II secretory pathway pseudopilin PulG
MLPRNFRVSFSLVELLAVVAIMAAVIAGAVFFTANYVTWAKQTSDKQTYTILNDALTRWKTEGGNVCALTVGAPIGNVLRYMQTPITLAGNMSHTCLRPGTTYPARSLLAVGNYAQYHFAQYNTYYDNTVTSGTPTSNLPYGSGVGYMANGGVQIYNALIESSTGWYAAQNASGTITRYKGNGTQLTLPVSASYTFWSCVSSSDSTSSGYITYINCSSSQITSLDVRGLTGLQQLLCESDNLTSLNVSNCTNLQTLKCDTNQLTGSLNVSGFTSLQYFRCFSNNLTSINASGCTSLKDFECYLNNLTSINVSGCTSMQTFECQNNQLTSLDASGEPSLTLLNCSANQLGPVNIKGDNALGGNLQDSSNTGSLSVTGP